MPLQDRVNNIRVRLFAEIGDGSGPIVFVCHSLGGLIVKQLLLDLNQLKDRNLGAKEFLDRVTQVVFLATPHTGSQRGSLLETLRYLAWPSAIARVLVANDPTLRHINVSYRDLADDRRATLEHLVFFETQNTIAGRIVDEASADPGLPGDRPVAIDVDHIFIAKPESRSALQYVLTRNLVAKALAGEGQRTGFSAYDLPEVKIDHAGNVAPKLIRLAAIVGLAVIIFLGVRAFFGGSANAACASNAQSGWIFGNSVKINVQGSTLDCPKEP
jgi:pimeloyl-ACP methyl ester carboxylesterase